MKQGHIVFHNNIMLANVPNGNEEQVLEPIRNEILVNIIIVRTS